MAKKKRWLKGARRRLQAVLPLSTELAAAWGMPAAAVGRLLDQRGPVVAAIAKTLGVKASLAHGLLNAMARSYVVREQQMGSAAA